MRFPHFFHPERTTRDERVGIMTAFIGRVRDLLDRTARNSRHRWLCVRIPAHRCVHDGLGIDLARWADAGVEMVNLSYHYFTEQDGDYAGLRQLAPDVSMYVEMTHTTSVGPLVTGGEHDNFTFRRTTPRQFETTAHLAYANGLDGISAFNFVYYRPHGGGARGPFDEPPFDVFRRLGDPAWLARQPQHYFLGNTWDCPRVPDRPLPRDVRIGETAVFQLRMAPPENGWKTAGRLRIQSTEDLGDSRWGGALNGVELAETQDRSEPYENPYSPLLGTPAQHRAWTVPVALLRDGVNDVDITLFAGDKPVPLVFLDVAWLQASAGEP
jgi:hypothetical protein